MYSREGRCWQLIGNITASLAKLKVGYRQNGGQVRDYMLKLYKDDSRNVSPLSDLLINGSLVDERHMTEINETY